MKRKALRLYLFKLREDNAASKWPGAIKSQLVCAVSPAAARAIFGKGDNICGSECGGNSDAGSWEEHACAWSNPEEADCEYLGVAKLGITPGILLSA